MRLSLCAVVLSAVATLAVGATHENSIDVLFPDDVAGLAFAGKTAFPQKELGVNIAYQRSGPVRGSVFIYNGGMNSIPSDIESPVVKKHFAQVISEVKQLESAGKVRSVNLSGSSEHTTSYSGCGPQFIWRTYEMELGEGMRLVSSTYLTAMKNNFVKLRISYRKGDTQGGQDAERFVQQIRKVLGNCK